MTQTSNALDTLPTSRGGLFSLIGGRTFFLCIAVAIGLFILIFQGTMSAEIGVPAIITVVLAFAGNSVGKTYSHNKMLSPAVSSQASPLPGFINNLTEMVQGMTSSLTKPSKVENTLKQTIEDIDKTLEEYDKSVEGGSRDGEILSLDDLEDFDDFDDGPGSEEPQRLYHINEDGSPASPVEMISAAHPRTRYRPSVQEAPLPHPVREGRRGRHRDLSHAATGKKRP